MTNRTKAIHYSSIICTGSIYGYFFYTNFVISISMIALGIYLCTSRKDFFIWHLCCGIVSMYWCVGPIFLELNKFWWVMPFALVGGPFAIAYMNSVISYDKMCIPIAWTGIEISRTYLLHFPWNLIGYSAEIHGIAQFASIAGVFGVTFLILVIAVLCSKAEYFWTGIILAISVYCCGELRRSVPIEYTTHKAVIVPTKSNKNMVDYFDEMYRKSSDFPLANNLVIWPESSLRFAVDGDQLPIPSPVDGAGLLITGGQRIISEHDDYRMCSLFASDANNKIIASYDKIWLVPFGEFIPFLNIGMTNVGMYYLHGTNVPVFSTPYGKALFTICYDACFPYPSIIDYIVNISNDRWFILPLGKLQNYYIPRMRAIELGAPLLRASNEGISAVISPFGNEIYSSHDIEIKTMIPKRLPYNTIFSVTGNTTVIVLMGLWLLFVTKIRRNLWD